MESVSAFPFKSTRKLLEEDIGKPIIECKRQFKLTRQFPSRVYKKKLGSDSAPSQISSKSLSKGDLNVNSLNKIRIRTQDGKDLGEFKLKLLPPELINETIISNSLQLMNNTHMPITLLFENGEKLKNASQTLEVNPSNTKLLVNVNKEKSNSKKLVNGIQYINCNSLDKSLSNFVFLQNKNKYSELCNTQVANVKFPQYKITVPNNEVFIPLNKLHNSNLKSVKTLKRKASPDNAISNKMASSDNTVIERKATSDNTITNSNGNSDNATPKRGTSTDNVAVKRKPVWNNVVIKKSANLDNIEQSTLNENGIEMPFVKINILRKPHMKINYDPQKSISKVRSPEKSISKVRSPEKSISRVCIPEKLISKDYVPEKLVSTKLKFKDCFPEKLISKDCVLKKSLSEVTTPEKSKLKSNTEKRLEIEATAVDSSIVVPVSEKSMSKLKKQQRSLIQSRFPVVACEKIVIPKTKVAINRIGQVISKVDSNKLNSSLAQRCILRDAILQSDAQTPSSNVKDTFIAETVCNAREKACNITSVSNDTGIITLNSSDDESCSNMVPESKDSCFKSTDNSTNDTKEAASDKKKPQKLLEQWDIIKEALISVKDEELRAKALQALTDCGIGIAKHIPITPPENLKTVHNSQIQTDVFGLLEEENFILVKEDVTTLQRIKQKVQSTTTFGIGLNSMSTVTQSIDFNNENSLTNSWLLLQEELQEIDNVFNQDKHNTAREVEQILTEPSYSVCLKVGMQLKRDFEQLQDWDEEGLLCIHRAVINDNLQEVKRLMLVLKACGMSIDVLTENDKTCLELAIQTNTSEAIVKLLLEAGAKPVSSEPLHESAVMIACKMSSPLLPILLQYVKDHELLNKVDSSGFAPLHYCALYGNLDGVNALLTTRININLKDNRSGRTPIFHAIETNNVKIAQKLLAHGAIVNIPNFAGQSVTTLIEETKSLMLRTALQQIIL